MKILDKRIETIDKQIGEMCVVKKSIDNNQMISQKQYYESGNNYYNATFNKQNIRSSNDGNIDYYQPQNEMISEEIDVAKNDLNDENDHDDRDEIDNLYQNMQNMEVEDKDIYEIIN